MVFLNFTRVGETSPMSVLLLTGVLSPFPSHCFQRVLTLAGGASAMQPLLHMLANYCRLANYLLGTRVYCKVCECTECERRQVWRWNI